MLLVRTVDTDDCHLWDPSPADRPSSPANHRRTPKNFECSRGNNLHGAEKNRETGSKRYQIDLKFPARGRSSGRVGASRHPVPREHEEWDQGRA